MQILRQVLGIWISRWSKSSEQDCKFSGTCRWSKVGVVKSQVHVDGPRAMDKFVNSQVNVDGPRAQDQGCKYGTQVPVDSPRAMDGFVNTQIFTP